MKTAIVVGGGLSGLSSAYRLKQAGWSVKVLEKELFPGGRARTETTDGFVIDTGPDAISTAYTDYQQLARELGLGDRFVPSSRVVGMLRGQRVHDIDIGSPFSAPLSPALSLAAKLRLIRGWFTLRREIASADAFELVRLSAQDDPDDTALDYARRYFGSEIADYLIDPLVRLVTGASASDASMLAVLGALSAWSSQLINIKGGMALLPRTIAAQLDMVYGATVSAIEPDADGVTVRYADAQGQERTERADAAVAATFFDTACEISPYLNGRLGDLAARLRRLRHVAVSLAYGVPTKSRAYVVNVPTAESPEVSLIFMQHHKAPDRVPPGKSMLSLYIAPRAYETLAARSDAEITRFCRTRIERWFPELAGHFLFSHVNRWEGVGWLAVPGYYRVVQEIRDRIDPGDRLQVAGDVFSAGSMETAIRWGRFAAENIERAHGHAAPEEASRAASG